MTNFEYYKNLFGHEMLNTGSSKEYLKGYKLYVDSLKVKGEIDTKTAASLKRMYTNYCRMWGIEY